MGSIFCQSEKIEKMFIVNLLISNICFAQKNNYLFHYGSKVDNINC